MSQLQSLITYLTQWGGGDGTSPVTITLREGNPSDLTTISTLTSECWGSRAQAHMLTLSQAMPLATRTRGPFPRLFRPLAITPSKLPKVNPKSITPVFFLLLADPVIPAPRLLLR